MGTAVNMEYKYKSNIKSNQIPTWAMGQKQKTCPKTYAYTTLSYTYKIEAHIQRSKFKQNSSSKFTFSTDSSSRCRKDLPLDSKLGNIY